MITHHLQMIVDELAEAREIQIQVVNSVFWGCWGRELFKADRWYAPYITERQCFLIFGRTYDNDFEGGTDKLALISSTEAMDLLVHKVHQKIINSI